MNLNRARDFYSAYYEKTLDQGLRQAFEHALASDAAVSAEFRQFVRIMDELKVLEAPVEVPEGLHLMIRERVDAHINAGEAKSPKSEWFFAWRPIAYGLVATVAIIGVVASFGSGPKDVGTAGFVGLSSTAPTLVFSEGSARLRLDSAEANEVRVTRVADGSSLAVIDAKGKSIDSPITNSSDSSEVVRIGFAQDYEPLYLAVPGKKAVARGSGSGTLADFMAAMAGTYRVPIVCESLDVQRPVSWKLGSTDPLSEAKDELDSLGLKAEIRQDGLVWISLK